MENNVEIPQKFEKDQPYDTAITLLKTGFQ